MWHACERIQMYTLVSLANPEKRNRLNNWWAIIKPILTPIDVLPAFQVQVLICTGDSCSNPERSAYRQILLVVNDLIRKTVRGLNGRYGTEKLEPGQNIRQLSSW